MELNPDVEPSASLPQRRGARDRLLNRVSVMGQLTALLAMTSTGVTAGVLAHDAQVKDLQAAQDRQRAQPPAVAAPVRLVPKPVRTVLVRLPARKAKRTVSRTSSGTTTTRRSAAAPVVRRAPVRVTQPAPKPAPKPAATTSSGS
jgi:hypothetical protein